MSWVTQNKELLQIAKSYEPKVKNLLTTDNWFMKFLSILAFVFSFGKTSPADWRDNIALAFCGRIFFSKSLSIDTVSRILPHETKHITQQAKAGFGNYWIGIIPWLIFYYLFPLPIGLAIGRCLLEIDADINQWLAHKLTENQIIESATYRAEQLSSFKYGWSAPTFITKWLYEKAVEYTIKRTRKIFQ